MKKTGTVTTADVAERAGLSKMTVSRVLNGHPYVSDETRRRVMQAVDELGFTPNTLAKRFFTGRTQLIGFMMPIEYMFSSYYFEELFRGVFEVLEENNYDLLLHNSKSERHSALDKSRDLVKGHLVDGLLLVAPMSHDAYPADLVEEGIPLVVVGETAHGDSVPRVGIDNRKISEQAVKRLIDAGHRNIGVLTFNDGHIEGAARREGYMDAMKAAGLPADDRFVGAGRYQRREGCEETIRIMREHPEVTALFAANLDMAMGALEGLRSLNLRVPEDVSLVAFDDSEELENSEPPVSAVRQYPYRIGLSAADMLLEMIEREEKPAARTKMIETDFIERASIAAPRA